jgi:hypothetical protein
MPYTQLNEEDINSIDELVGNFKQLLERKFADIRALITSRYDEARARRDIFPRPRM